MTPEEELKAQLILATDPNIVFTPLNGPVPDDVCPKVGERYVSKFDIVEVKDVKLPQQILTLEVVKSWDKPAMT